ncbi:hypothetical protein V2I01_04395 [Micromonospora sp. BRA006-A]|nr:hypothetical protein [Micromonospora sp. BRA006-A]
MIARALELDPQARRTALYPVCSPARAVVDAARDLRGLRPVRATVAEAVQRGFTDLDSLDAEIRRARRSRTALIRKAFAEITDGVRSAPETELRECLGSSRVLGEILWNPRLSAADGARLPTPDGYLADCAVALEVDSREYHLSPADWARTLDRHNELSRHGVLILHFTPAQIRREPAACGARWRTRTRRGAGWVPRPAYGRSRSPRMRGVRRGPFSTRGVKKGPFHTPQQPGRRSIR